MKNKKLVGLVAGGVTAAYVTCTRTHVGEHLWDSESAFVRNLYPYACGGTSPLPNPLLAGLPVPVRMWGNNWHFPLLKGDRQVFLLKIL